MKNLLLLSFQCIALFSFSQLDVPDFNFPKNRQFHQLQGNEFVVSYSKDSTFYFSKVNAALDTLWMDSLQFTDPNVNISQSGFTNFPGSDKSLLTLGYHPYGYQIVDSNSFYENIVIDFDNEEILNRTTDTILHSLEIKFLALSDTSIYVFVPRRDVSGYPYYCETRKINAEAELEYISPFSAMTFNEQPAVTLFRPVDDTLWIIQGISHDVGYSYSMEIDSLRAYQQFPVIYNGSTSVAPNLMYKQFLNDDTLFVMRQFEYANYTRTWILYNYKRDLNIRYYRVNPAPQFNSEVYYSPIYTQIFDGKIYVLAYTDDAAKHSRIFVYDLNFEPLCEIALPHTLGDQNSLILINNQLYYRYAINQTEYAYYKLNHCNQLMGVDDMSFESVLNVFPNPSEGIFNVSVDAKLIGKSYKITDISGKLILEGKIAAVNEVLNLSALQKGIYLLAVENQKVLRLIKK